MAKEKFTVIRAFTGYAEHHEGDVVEYNAAEVEHLIGKALEVAASRKKATGKSAPNALDKAEPKLKTTNEPDLKDKGKGGADDN